MEKVAKDGQGFGLGLLQVVVDHDVVEARSERQFVGGLVHAGLDDLGGIRAAPFEAAAQLVDGGRLDEEGERAVAVELLDVAAAYHVHIEDHVLSGL